MTAMRDREEIKQVLFLLTASLAEEVRQRVYEGNLIVMERACYVANTLNWVLNGDGTLFEEVRKYVERRLDELGYKIPQ